MWLAYLYSKSQENKLKAIRTNMNFNKGVSHKLNIQY